MALWSVLLAPRYPVVTELIEFLSVSVTFYVSSRCPNPQQESGTYKGANKDIWNMVDILQ